MDILEKGKDSAIGILEIIQKKKLSIWKIEKKYLS